MRLWSPMKVLETKNTKLAKINEKSLKVTCEMSMTCWLCGWDLTKFKGESKVLTMVSLITSNAVLQVVLGIACCTTVA